MTDQDDGLNTWIAERVMGWNRHISPCVVVTTAYWYNNKGRSVILCANWHPTRSIEQAVECARKLVQSDPSFEMTFELGLDHTEAIVWSYGKVAASVENSGTLELDICLAIREAFGKE